MKKMPYILILAFITFALVFGACAGSDSDDDDDNNDTEIDYRQEMRNFVQAISQYAKGINPNFNVITQNGQELLTRDGEENGSPDTTYIKALDGVGQEDLFYGYTDDNEATPANEKNYLIAFLDVAKNNGLKVLVTDYCWTRSYMEDSYFQNEKRGYISFAADHRELDNIPAYPTEPYNVSSQNIMSLSDARNFLYLINPSSFPNKGSFLEALRETDYDVFIIDLFYDEAALTAQELASLKIKANGGTRKVIAYMSIGEAESYRFYWQDEWNSNPPSWLAEENPDWPGNFKVRYWDPAWQSIIYGNDGSYVKKILDAGFDGTYLDIIDAFEYFE
ncbi:endo alpha-1,4 polygalactosaminidase [candidate division CSSED10-310 bacterium]|uniref:Endo alpha-1,4 polygalactosaminidase n=1 Tax=candidate division CSSED10-310 bacterium TaxID=2855610 RepID=A0ABV6YUG6_UNCC1